MFNPLWSLLSLRLPGRPSPRRTTNFRPTLEGLESRDAAAALGASPAELAAARQEVFAATGVRLAPNFGTNLRTDLALRARDRNFFRFATQSNLLGIRLGTLAQQQGDSAAVRAFGRLLAEDQFVAQVQLRRAFSQIDLGFGVNQNGFVNGRAGVDFDQGGVNFGNAATDFGRAGSTFGLGAGSNFSLGGGSTSTLNLGAGSTTGLGTATNFGTQVSDFQRISSFDFSQGDLDLSDAGTATGRNLRGLGFNANPQAQAFLRASLRLGRGQQRLVRELRQLSGPEFDRRFLEVTVGFLQQTITRYQTAAEGNGDAVLSAYALQRLPSLRALLETATELQTRLQSGSLT